MRDCKPGTYLSSLWLSHYWPWSRSEWNLLLLCELCGQRRSARSAGPKLKVRLMPCAGYFGHPFHPDMYTLTRFGVTIYHIHVPLVRKEGTMKRALTITDHVIRN